MSLWTRLGKGTVVRGTEELTSAEPEGPCWIADGWRSQLSTRLKPPPASSLTDRFHGTINDAKVKVNG